MRFSRRWDSSWEASRIWRREVWLKGIKLSGKSVASKFRSQDGGIHPAPTNQHGVTSHKAIILFFLKPPSFTIALSSTAPYGTDTSGPFFPSQLDMTQSHAAKLRTKRHKRLPLCWRGRKLLEQFFFFWTAGPREVLLEFVILVF